MNRNAKPEIDELLSAYLDGQLSDRQHTEVKRLLRNDKDVSLRLHRLQQQKQLLSALPVETAPAGMLEAIQASLERTFILDRFSHTTRTAAGARQLFARRFLTAAAMLIIPLGLLAWVVFTILSPAETPTTLSQMDDPGGSILMPNLPPQKPMPREQLRPNERSSPAVGPMAMTLSLRTSEPIVVDSLLKKAIFNHSLFTVTVPGRLCYTIQCPAEPLIALMQDVQSVWPKCRTASLAVFGRTVHSRVIVDRITPDQIVQLLQQPNSLTGMQLAGNFASLNSVIAAVPSYGLTRTAPNEEWFTENPSMPVKPELAEPFKPTENLSRSMGSTVTLHILIESR